MKKILLNEDRKLEVLETSPPGVPRGGVLVSMSVAAVCRTDLKMFESGQRDLSLPRILGHEGVGEIIESDNPSFETGAMVAIYPGIFCGECEQCKRGITAQCQKIRIYGFNEDGFFRSIIPFHEGQLRSLVPFPKGLDPEQAVLAEPLACCLNAVRKFKSVKKERALIIGAGAVGSIFAALLKMENWGEIIIADMNRQRLLDELPRGVKTIDTSSSSLFESLDNKKVDLIIPACPDGLKLPFWEIMNQGGCVSFFSGNHKGDELLPIDMNAVHYKELTLAGSYGCNIGDFRSALNMLAAERIDLTFFRFYRIPVEEISDGMETLSRQSIKKVIINRF
ncbi:MAG: alcohol dehydrogenase catalytic domain-containing protein [Syntrophales bacterium]|nr:alcohol dehydrogenase catalytic domain-containing protein [Syntrophales bacterium]